ncbi:MAG: Hsp20/alpha crystallin family protein [Oscillospiraceae bacterium]|nr:Hsp20/alpha crystallin family protein [Oscillospiraceae bacterium]
MMTVVPYNQFRKNDLIRNANNFNGFFNPFEDFFSSGLSRSQSFFKVDILNKENEYVIEADLPGVAKEDIDLNIDDNILTISVEQQKEKTSEEKNYLHKERYVSSMKRRINLSDVKLDEISAKLENGVLNVTVPKDDPSNGMRKIDIA